VRLPAVGLGPQHPAEPLRLLLPRPERPRDLDRDSRLRQIDGEVAHPGDHQRRQFARTERVEEPLALLVCGGPLDDRRVQVLADLVQLVEVGADHQDLVVLVPVDERLDHRQLGPRGRGHPVLVLVLADRVGHPLLVGERRPHLDALGRRDPTLRLDVLPRRVVPLGADE
jgi:hypothetical protein